ncbi:MAG: enoyl-CoA hydratase/isomerase family protein [Deltaproteobacteria bacterium]|nr:enoyl-CoA hydratase/isomerase family protein [Deltaproteobacteria bacterium]
MSEATIYEIRRDAAWITLNQPDKRNALSEAVVAGLLAGLRSAIADERVRVIVITGAGPAFCAGADLKSGGVRATDEENPFVTVMKTIWESPKPVIGRINGPAFGGGVGLAAACDLTVAADSAVFSFSEVRVGVIPAMISVLVIPKLGIQNTMWLFLTGERFSAQRAADLGLIHRTVPAADLDKAVAEVIAMVRLGGPNAIGEAKQLVRRIPGLSLDEGFRYTSKKIGQLFASAEAAEGMQAFVEKRKPKWAE